MKLTVLTENLAGGSFLAEHGLSYLIETDEKIILFDTGHSNVFLQNAEKMGIDLSQKVDLIVLSHGHWDHGDGLRYIENKPLITHPASFIKRFRKNDMTPLGLSLSKEEIENKFQLKTTKEPDRISSTCYFLGEIPQQNDFEAQTTVFTDESGNDDFVPDDSGLVIVKNEKLIIISGCAHSGICNICEYAKRVTGIQQVSAVIGGFHLKHNNKQTQETIRYFEKEKVDILFPSHCTELPALTAFHTVFKIGQLKTGQIIEI